MGFKAHSHLRLATVARLTRSVRQATNVHTAGDRRVATGEPLLKSSGEPLSIPSFPLQARVCVVLLVICIVFATKERLAILAWGVLRNHKESLITTLA